MTSINSKNDGNKNDKDKKNYYFNEQYITSLWFSNDKSKKEK
jgi:hypothetical protein